jgi:hypothetical protein
MTLKLNNILINLFSDIDITYEWNEIFNINFMDYFPLLKNGITTKNIYYKVIAAYGVKYNFINKHDIMIKYDLIQEISIIEILIRIYKSLFNISFTEKNIKLILNKIIDTNIDEFKDLLNESNLANSLFATIQIAGPIINKNSDLLKLICLFDPKGITSTILKESLKKSSLRLLSDVLYNNTEDLAIALYIDEVDYYIGYKDLYILAISYGSIKVADMLKDAMITKNLYMKYVLTINLENLIGPSDIPNIVYNYI